MNIVLINSPLQDYSKTKKQEYYTTPPLGLGSLATIAQDLGCNVKLIDAEALGLSPQQTAEITKEQNPDLVGINLITPTINFSKDIASRLKNDKIKIIGGGPHAIIKPEQSLSYIPELDFLFRGEAEKSLEKLIRNDLNPSSINGISYVKKGNIIHNPNEELITDLDSLPFIDRSFFVDDPHQDGNMRKVVIIGSRGCPYLCTFCSGPLVSGKKIRARSIENVVDEIEMLKETYGVNSVHFLDNDFVYRKSRALEFADELEKRNLDISWRALTRVDKIAKYGEGFVRRLKDSGCYQLVFGIESGTQRILDLIRKGTTPEQARESVELCKKVGIKTKAYYMFGFPTETISEMEKTLDHALELNTDMACFVLVRAYPGTEMYKSLSDTHGDKLQSYAYLQDVALPDSSKIGNSAKYHIGNTISFSEATPKQLNDMLRKAYNVYYTENKRSMVA